MKGFTLIEILLVVALISLTVTGGLMLQRSLASAGHVQTGGSMVMSALRQAQARAGTMTQDDGWGVHVASASVTVFKGADFAGRDDTLDLAADLPAPVQITGTEDVIFAKGNIVPVAVASLSLGSDEESMTVRVNEEGMISYELH